LKLPINKIICGDCLEVVKDWPDNCVDLVVTSPPYGKLRDYKGYDFNFKLIAKQLFRIIKRGGMVVWIVGDETIDGNETGNSFRQALYFKKIGFSLHDTMIYAKRGFSNPSNNRYHQIFEYMFVLSKGKLKTFNPIKDRRNIEKHRGGDTKRQKDGTMLKGNKGGSILDYFGQRYNIWNYKIGGGNVSTNRIAHEHPAIFPEKLAADHIISWSNENNIVLDPFCGSGTTCVATKMLGRKYIGIDISEKYCKISRKRLKGIRLSLFEKPKKKRKRPSFELSVKRRKK